MLLQYCCDLQKKQCTILTKKQKENINFILIVILRNTYKIHKFYLRRLKQRKAQIITKVQSFLKNDLAEKQYLMSNRNCECKHKLSMILKNCFYLAIVLPRTV